MKKILLIQARLEQAAAEAELQSYQKALGDSTHLEALSVLDEQLAWTTPDEILDKYDGVIFGGSGDFDISGGRIKSDPARLIGMIIFTRLPLFIAYILEKDMPALAICFGHQLVAQMQGGDVDADDSQKKTGTYDVRLTEEGKSDRLFGSLPETFAAHYMHRDSVTTEPVGAVILASGDMCKFSAVRYKKNVYTVQFHPELSADVFVKRLKLSTGYLPEGVRAEDMVRDAKGSESVISSWLERVVAVV